MSQTLAKITAPQSKNVYKRKRLFKELDIAREKHAVIWISSPAGSGKTTLVASYLQQKKIKPLWYQVDEGDTDPASFFYYLGLLSKQVAALKKALPLLTAEYHQGIPAFARNYFREFFTRITDPSVVVFDNYQLADTNKEFQECVNIALEQIPPHIQIIIISRLQPDQAYSRLLATESIMEIGWDKIQLADDEYSGIVKVLANTTKIPAAVVSNFQRYSKGWVTGLVLLLQQGHSPIQDIANEIEAIDVDDEFENQEALFNYFASEILSNTDKVTQGFLYQTALLSIFTPSVAKDLTGISQAKRILIQLVSNNFFTVRHGFIKVSFEYHPLFRQFLLNRLESHYENSELDEIKIKAGYILAESGQFDMAVKLFIETQNWQALSNIIIKQADQLNKQGRDHVLQNALDALPTEIRQQNPWLLYWHGMVRLHIHSDSAYPYFVSSYHLFKQSKDSAGIYRSWLGIAESLFFSLDDYAPAITWIKEFEEMRKTFKTYPNQEVKGRIALSIVSLLTFADPKYDTFQNWITSAERAFKYIPNSEVKCFAGATLGRYYTFFGKNSKIHEIAKVLKPISQSEKVLPFARLLAHWTLTTDAWQFGNLDEALVYAEKGLAFEKEAGINVVNIWMLSVSIMTYLAKGNVIESDNVIQRIFNVANMNHALESNHVHMLSAWFQVLNNNYDIAEEQIHLSVLDSKKMHAPFFESTTHVAYAQVLIFQNKYDKAEEQLQIAIELDKRMDNLMVTQWYISYVHAWLYLKRNNRLKAKIYLQMMFSKGQNHGFQTTTFWFPEVMSLLSYEALDSNIEISQVKKFIRQHQLQIPSDQPPIDAWPYPIKIYTLGRFSLLSDDEPQTLTSKSAQKPMALLKCLIAFGGRQVSQEKINEALWPDAEGDSARRNFDTTLFRLRKLLNHDQALVLKEGLLSLDSSYVWADNWALERLLSQLERYEKSADKSQILILQEKLFLLYKGDFLSVEADRSWSIVLKERLRNRMLKCLLQLGNFWQEQKQFDQAEKCYEKGLTLNPLHEQFYQQLMQMHVNQGNNAQMAATYEQCRKILSTTLGVMPSEQTTVIYQNLENL